MALILLSLVVLLPLVEIWVALAVAGQVGGLLTLVLLVALSLFGVFLIRREGISAWRAVQRERRSGGTPTLELVKGAIAVGGALLLVIPGFVTAGLGLLILVPPVRSILARILIARITERAARAVKDGRMQGVFISSVPGADGRVHREATTFGTSGDPGDVIDSEGWDVTDRLGIGIESGPESRTATDSNESFRSPNSSRSSSSGVIDTD